jgi:hypothetical protein
MVKMLKIREITLNKIERWIKEVCSIEDVTGWDWDGETLTVISSISSEHYSYDVVYSEIAPMFVVVDTSEDYPDHVGFDVNEEEEQSKVHHTLESAIDRAIELNDNENVPGVWEVFKLCPLSYEDGNKWLPETKGPVAMIAEPDSPEPPPFVEFLNDASKKITWQDGEESKEITVSFYPDGTFVIIDGQDNLPTWYQFE